METPKEQPQTEKPARKYDFESIEAKCQTYWEENRTFQAPEIARPAEKFYMLVMWPYPSGDIHMGHFRNYIIGDAVARRQMMLGKDVLHPLGWDAFGLPAERAAIQRNIHPADWTYSNIKVSRDTLKKVGISYDWSREVASCDPEYYKWTQWIFIQLFKKGLAYRKRGFVNWCPEDKTVLANEQVKDGKCERCGSLVEKKVQIQWYFKITEYADRLIDDLDTLPGWPENVKTMQREWIGRSHGLEIDFKVESTGEKIPIFTTRPDTVYGVTYLAIAPESESLSRMQLAGEYKVLVEDYIKKSAGRTDIERVAANREKDGVFTGLYAVNPFSGEKIPIWVADYVLAGYGTGAVMAVPAHDERDFSFATKYNLGIKVVLQGPASTGESLESPSTVFTDYGAMVNSGNFNRLSGETAIAAVNSFAESKVIGRIRVNYKLKDWSVSRQRYWGCPIPIIHCPKCGEIPVPDDQLPVILPKVDNFMPKGRSPLADVPEYINTTCPKCGGPAERDSDTMDTFTCSSWYHLRYMDPNNDKSPVNAEKAKSWMPIDLYVGGITHATGHLIYFRFFTKFLHDLGLLSFSEPATRFFNHGMVADSKGEVMSKSKGNVVSPIALMESRGVDITRLGMFFTAPSEMPVLWSSDSLTGVEKFVLSKFYPLKDMYRRSNPDLKQRFNLADLSEAEKEIYIRLNQTIKKITDDSERLQFNTVVSALMELIRDYDPNVIPTDKLNDSVILKAVQLIAPLAPHMAEEMWASFGFTTSIFKSNWPVADQNASVGETIVIAIQVNGKLRDSVTVPTNAGQELIEQVAMATEKVKSQTLGKEIIRKIYVPSRLLNIVVK